MVEDLQFEGAAALLPVPADALRSTWAMIRARVDKLEALAGERWIAEDVFHELVVGNAHLWATADAGGFVVLRVFASAYGRDLFVWLCWNDGATPARLFIPQMRELAVANACDRVVWETPREGFDRLFPGVKRTNTYSFEVGE